MFVGQHLCIGGADRLHVQIDIRRCYFGLRLGILLIKERVHLFDILHHLLTDSAIHLVELVSCLIGCCLIRDSLSKVLDCRDVGKVWRKSSGRQ